MLSKARLVMGDLKLSARRPVLILWFIGLVAFVGTGWLLGDTPLQRLLGAALSGIAWLTVVVLVASEAGRQDRLRSRLVRRAERDESPEPVSEPDLPRPRLRTRAPETPTVTVVVTVFNESRHLDSCLRSVIAQTWPDWECVVVDDASTDASLDRIIDLVADDPRLRIVHHPENRGLSAARNTGLALARGRYVTFLDGDDFLYPNAIEARLDAVSSSDDPGWVIGAYCGWHSVAEDAEPGSDPPVVPRRLRVSWFDAIFDAPFIASAPLLSTDAVRLVGGFDETLATAEDFDLWSRLLRQGYVVEYADTTGVAYRQKEQSMYRASGTSHADVTIAVYERNAAALPTHESIDGTPFTFTDSPLQHQKALATFRRRVVAFTGSLRATGADVAAHEELRRLYQPWMKRVVDLPALVTSTAHRLESHDPRTQAVRARELTRRTLEALDDVIVDPAPRSAPPPAMRSHGRELVRSTRLPWTAPPAGSRPVLILPSVAYHCDEMGPLADTLAAMGENPVFGVLDRRWGSVRRELMKYPYPVFRMDGPELDLRAVAEGVKAIVTLNDWGDHKEIVEAANALGVPTYGKVEGVQDFEDVDVYWKRHPYQAVTHVLAQGLNDVEALPGQRSTIVGSTRLERIWLEPPRHGHRPLAVLNLNFTYGVLDEARDMWLASAVAACRRAGIPYTISMHPAERAHVEDPNVSDHPMRHLLTQATVLVSRFSTVPFEAMARGVPFVYHNPHGEKVPTFQDPEGAFEISTDITSLVSALAWATDALESYRARCGRFFERQVDIDVEKPSEQRAAAVILEAISSS